jgi:hypothetical protein
MVDYIIRWNDNPDKDIQISLKDLDDAIKFADGFRKGFSDPNFVHRMEIFTQVAETLTLNAKLGADKIWTIGVNLPYNLPDELDLDVCADCMITLEIQETERIAAEWADWMRGQ